jgi:uncharacterized protein (DUF3084 family)
MSFPFGLNLKGWAIIALVIALGGWAGYQKYQIHEIGKERDTAQQEAKSAKDERDLAALARDAAIAANVSNQQVIAELQKEKADIQTSLNNLDADRRRNQATIASLSASIKALAKDPANQVTLSPVLKVTVQEIQAERARRQGEAK